MHPIAGHQVLSAVMALQQLEFPPLVLVENVRQ
jgi:DNA (cytosine-5)-methyltransferase 1